MRTAGRVVSLTLAVVVSVAALRSWREARGHALLEQYRVLRERAESPDARGGGADDVDPAAETLRGGRVVNRDAGDGAGASSERKGDVEGTGAAAGRAYPDRDAVARRDLLRRAIAQGSVTSEGRTALAIERIQAASARVLAGEDRDPGDHEEVSAEAGAGAAEELRSALEDVVTALHASPASAKAWLAGYRVVETARILGRTEALASADHERSGLIAASLRQALREPSRLSMTFIEGAVRSDPNGGDLHHELGNVMLAAGDPDGAFEHFRRAVRDLSVDAVRVADEMLEGGYSPEEILTMMPRRFDAQYGVGSLLLTKGRGDLAEKALHEAARLDPGAYEAWTALSHLAESRGRHAEALAFARRALPLLPKLGPAARAQVLSCAAMASRSVGDFESAIAYGSRALEDDPQYLVLYNFVGSLLYDRGDAAGSIRYWQTLIDDHASDPYVASNLSLFHRLIGRSYERLGMPDRAVEHYLDALHASPQDPETRAALARLARP